MMLRTVSGMLFALAFLQADDSPQSEPRLVDLNIIAVDSHGEPVTDLTADDFQVTDAGKPQKIAFFRGKAGGPEQNSALEPNQFSNRPNGEAPRATVILFDLLNESFGTRGVAANQIVKSLQNFDVAAPLYLYIMTVDGKLLPVHGVSPVEGAPPQPQGAAWTRQIKPLMDEAMKTAMRVRPPDIDVFIRVQMTYALLDAVGVQLSALPGRKNVVWVTDGVPVGLGWRRSDTGEDVDFTPQIRRLSEVLDLSHVMIYPVRQVLLGSPDQIGATSGGNGATGGAGTGVSSIDTLDQFANLTGGRRSADKDIGGAIRQAISDLRFGYQIGYYAPASNWDGKFHKLRVTTKRKGVRLQAKTGYYAWAAPPGSRAQQAFDEASRMSLDAGEIGLRAAVSRDGDGARIEVSIDARDVALVRQGDRYTDQLRVMTAGYLPDGRTESGSVLPLDVQLSADERTQALKEGIKFTESLTAARNEEKFRVIVFDRGSNAVGSVTIPAAALRGTQQ